MGQICFLFNFIIELRGGIYENLKYFIDISHNFLFAYERSTEFFVRYIEKTKEWEACNISFSNFKHDYAFRAVDEDEAIKITNGNLPEAAFRQYTNMINRNLGYYGNE
jgi:hypothetical protein